METREKVKKAWKLAPEADTPSMEALKTIDPFLRQLLFNRGIRTLEEAKAYLNRETSHSRDPFQLKDMATAVDLVHKHISAGSQIVIYGDYDVDGVTSSSLLFEFFNALGISTRVYIPNRFDEGYGLNLEAMEQLARDGSNLIITVDCGVRSTNEVAKARELGMDIIITDHHLPDKELPNANAVINPKRPDDTYPFKEFAGVGLAYKLAQAYLMRYPKEGVDADHWLDLVALGTVADIASLTGENRAMVYEGILRARKATRQGLFSLCRCSEKNLAELDSGMIGYQIGPRLNASGRLESALEAFELLTTTDNIVAGELAQKLNSQNKQRQAIEEAVRDQALADKKLDDPDSYLVFVYSPDFSPGVVGLAASKVVEAVYKPTIIGAENDGVVKASCRSIEEFHISDALDLCSDLLERHGGHSVAAGLTIKTENIQAFQARMNEIALETVGLPWPSPRLNVDMAIDLNALKAEEIPLIFNAVKALEPTGKDNPEAVFCSYDCQLTKVRTLKDGKHLKFYVRTTKNEYEAIAFQMGHLFKDLPEKVDLAYTFSENEWGGRKTIQLKVKDIRF